MSKKVIILGAGGHAKSIADIILKSNDELVGFLDDNIEVGTKIINKENIKVIGKIDDLEKYKEEYEFVIGIGSNDARENFANKYKLNYYTAIHKTSNIAVDVTIGEGTVIMAGACVNTAAQIGKHVIINTGAVVEHDNVILDYAHISPKAVLAGCVKVGKRSHVGVGAVVKNKVSICDDAIIGAGAVVVKDINDSGTYVGVPAKLMIK